MVINFWSRTTKPRPTVTYKESLAIPPHNGLMWLFGALFLVIIPHLLRLPLWMSVICLLIISWRVLAEYQHWALPSTFIKLLITFSIIVVLFIQFRTFNGLVPGSALLATMFCLKLLEMRSMKDAMVVVFLGYFLVAVSFLFDQSTLVGIYLFAVVLALTMALVVLNHPQATINHQRQHFKFASSLLLQAIPLMLIMFILFPRIPGPLWSMPNDQSNAKTGLSDSMSIGNITQLAESEEVAFRVKFDGAPPPAEQLYWRGPVLWYTDGRNWKGLDSPLPSKRPQFYGDAVSYTVTLQPHKQGWLFALDLPATVPSIALFKTDFQLISKDPINDVTRYAVISYPEYTTGALESSILHASLQLPNNRNPQTITLGQQWSQQGMAPAQIVNKALSMFQTKPYYYSRTPPALNSADPLDEFLFTTKRGFCEHYAASFVTLMRAANIPARVVTGYQGGEFNSVGDYLIVRQSRAHAWAEVWLAERGWMRIDPTAFIPNDRVESVTDTQRFNNTIADALISANSGWVSKNIYKLRSNLDALNHQWNQWVLGYGPDKQRELLDNIGFGKYSLQQLIVIMGLLIAVMVISVMIYLIYHRHRNNDPIIDSYHRFCKKLAGVGITRQPWQGPQAYCELACKQLPHLNQQITTITKHYIALRYRSLTSSNVKRFTQLVMAFKPKI